MPVTVTEWGKVLDGIEVWCLRRRVDTYIVYWLSRYVLFTHHCRFGEVLKGIWGPVPAPGYTYIFYFLYNFLYHLQSSSVLGQPRKRHQPRVGLWQVGWVCPFHSALTESAPSTPFSVCPFHSALTESAPSTPLSLSLPLPPRSHWVCPFHPVLSLPLPLRLESATSAPLSLRLPLPLRSESASSTPLSVCPFRTQHLPLACVALTLSLPQTQVLVYNILPSLEEGAGKRCSEWESAPSTRRLPLLCRLWVCPFHSASSIGPNVTSCRSEVQSQWRQKQATVSLAGTHSSLHSYYRVKILF